MSPPLWCLTLGNIIHIENIFALLITGKSVIKLSLSRYQFYAPVTTANATQCAGACICEHLVKHHSLIVYCVPSGSAALKQRKVRLALGHALGVEITEITMQLPQQTYCHVSHKFNINTRIFYY